MTIATAVSLVCRFCIYQCLSTLVHRHTGLHLEDLSTMKTLVQIYNWDGLALCRLTTTIRENATNGRIDIRLISRRVQYNVFSVSTEDLRP